MAKYVLFIMPFGKKTIPHQKNKKRADIQINFEKRFARMKKKIEDSNHKVYRVDGNLNIDIYSKMYKMIQAADIVIADITGLNANVMYELGARHALKDKQTIMFRSDDNNDVPFDVNTFSVISYKEILKDFKDYAANDSNPDSPIRKELKGNVDKTIFDDFNNNWNDLMKEYDNAKTNEEKIQTLNKYEAIFKNSEPFLQMLSLSTYKQDEGNLEHLDAALNIIEKLNLETSVDHETLGLACSIYRKKYEITKNEVDKNMSFNLSRRFISLFRTSYSVSSYAMHLLAESENGLIQKEYFEQEVERIHEMFNNIDTSIEPEYFKHTKNLINAMKGITTEEYNNVSGEHIDLTSKTAYDRAIANHQRIEGDK